MIICLGEGVDAADARARVVPPGAWRPAHPPHQTCVEEWRSGRSRHRWQSATRAPDDRHNAWRTPSARGRPPTISADYSDTRAGRLVLWFKNTVRSYSTSLLDLRMQVSSPRPAARPAPPTGHLLARTVDWRSGGSGARTHIRTCARHKLRARNFKILSRRDFHGFESVFASLFSAFCFLSFMRLRGVGIGQAGMGFGFPSSWGRIFFWDIC